MSKLIIEDWVLYDMDLVGFTATDAATGQDFADCKEVAKSLRVVGTQEQIEAAGGNYNIDEVYSYCKEKKGSFWEGIVFSETRKDRPTLKEYNAKFEKDLARYKEMYKKNNNEVLILRCI
tara:strand:+ start:93 stop:452 length:360 start_codon:yes stop_codon:yes gene_type:complete